MRAVLALALALVMLGGLAAWVSGPGGLHARDAMASSASGGASVVETVQDASETGIAAAVGPVAPSVVPVSVAADTATDRPRVAPVAPRPLDLRVILSGHSLTDPIGQVLSRLVETAGGPPDRIALSTIPGAPMDWRWNNRTQTPDAREDIAAFERYLANQGTAIVKVFLHVSRKEQRKRFLERIDHPEKNWKFSSRDIAERGYWDDYMAAYEEAIRATAAPHAPWYVVPADNKWFTRLVVAGALLATMGELDLAFPTLPAEEKARLAEARAKLMTEKD